MAIRPLGRTKQRQFGIYRDEMIPGLRILVDTVHLEGGKIIIQLGHAGVQATCINCNRCFIALAYDLPVRCYCKGLSA